MSLLGPMVVYDCYVIGKCCTGRDWCSVLGVTDPVISDQAMHLHQKLPVDATVFFWGSQMFYCFISWSVFFSLLEKYAG